MQESPFWAFEKITIGINFALEFISEEYKAGIASFNRPDCHKGAESEKRYE